MALKINEAPRIVLKKISAHQRARSCSGFFAIACCLPSIGLSVIRDNTIDDDCCCKDTDYTGCFPIPLTYVANMSLKHFKTLLQKAIKEGQKFDEDPDKEWAAYDNFARQQADATVKLLKEIIAHQTFSRGYDQAIKSALAEIQDRIMEEEKLAEAQSGIDRAWSLNQNNPERNVIPAPDAPPEYNNEPDRENTYAHPVLPGNRK